MNTCTCFFPASLLPGGQLYLNHVCLPSAALSQQDIKFCPEGMPTKEQVGVSSLSSPAQKAERVVTRERDLG